MFFSRWEKVKRRVLGGYRISVGVGIVANARFPSSFPNAIIHNLSDSNLLKMLSTKN